MTEYNENYHGEEIAVIGLSGRFPGANNIKEYWSNIKAGKETISFFTEEEIKESYRAQEDILKNPNFVKAKGIIENIDLFDSEFFDYTAKEAASMDPQFRVFHECVWTALEDAGYNSFDYPGKIGLFAGAGVNSNWIMEALKNLKEGEDSKTLETAILNMRDYFTTMISYKLNLKGPSMTVQTACSTSMTAIHLAIQSLLSGDCHMAVAGGVSIKTPQKTGYLYQEGMIQSSDGHCRVFDSEADGTVFGDGSGAIILKPLDDALEDKDHIYAIIKGSAINNDGNRKVGYTAPSTKGQINVIRTALQMAEVSPETISYVEAHGTGTKLGDPIEIEALTKAFNTNKKNFCRIGSVKSNIGHLNDASGVAGVIKVILSLKEGCIPPTINFNRSNPKIDFDNSPFVVNDELHSWESTIHPRRAGVSSFGIGGTNGHIILEEAPKQDICNNTLSGKNNEILIFSAQNNDVLEEMTDNMEDFLLKNPKTNISQVAHTLQTGRPSLQYRRTIAGDSVKEIIRNINERDSSNFKTYDSGHEMEDVVFCFPGQGSQYVGMGKDLYMKYQVFKDNLDHCFSILKNYISLNPYHILFNDNDDYQNFINQTKYTQPILFCLEYSLAQLLKHFGVVPKAMIGHSLGEYVAATLSGVIELKDAINLVSYRGSLIQNLPKGSMLTVQIDRETLNPYLKDNISLAAINTSNLFVLSGNTTAIDNLSNELSKKGHKNKIIPTSHAFHSKMMDPILDEFRDKLKDIKFNEPSIPYLSNLTGNWIKKTEAKNPEYWVRHLRETVQFSKGIKTILEKLNPIFIEVGPSNTLNVFIKQLTKGGNITTISTLRHPKESENDVNYLLNTMSDIWLHGLPLKWNNIRGEEKCEKLSLPTYPFTKKSYWIKSDSKLKDVNIDNDKTGRKQKKEHIINDIEDTLRDIWIEILGLEDIKVSEDFFQIGGNSLNMTSLVTQIQKEFSVNLNLSDIYNNPTIEKLTKLIEKQEKEAYLKITPLEKKENYKLSSAQRRTFLMHQRIGNSTSYNMPMALRCKGDIDISRFENTFRKLIERHEILRTSFEIKDGEPVQKVLENFEFKIKYTSAVEKDLESEINDFIRPFDLKCPPLIRVKFVQIEEKDYLLLVDMHNIVADGTSMNIFIKEFTKLYQGEELPPLEIQYKDYAGWEINFTETSKYLKQKEYWTKLFKEYPPVLNMPYDFKRSRNNFTGDVIKFNIDKSTTEKIEEIGNKNNLTNNSILFFLYGVLLSQYSNQNEILIGSLVAGRKHADIQNTIGMFTNFLPIKLEINKANSIIEQLEKTKNVLLEAYENQDYPFDQMVENLGTTTRPHRNPFFDTMLIYHNEYDPDIKIKADGVDFENYEFSKGISKLDMKLDIVKEENGELKCAFQYNTALLKRKSAENIIANFYNIIKKAINNPNNTLQELDIINDKKDKVIETHNDTCSSNKHFTLSVSSTFTADSIASYINYWNKYLDLDIELKFSPYNQLYQELLNDNSMISKKKNGANILLIRIDDLDGLKENSLDENIEIIHKNLEEIYMVMKEKKKDNKYLFGILPSARYYKTYVNTFVNDWMKKMNDLDDVHIIDCRSIQNEYQIEEVLNPIGERIANMPYSETLYSALATKIVRELVAWKGKKFKVAVLDCDNTLWSGEVDEVGYEGISIEKEHKILHEFLKKKKEEGFIFLLSSKNDEKNVLDVFDKREDMILKREDFVDWRINWNEKSKNIREMANRLDISLSHFIFLDDDAAQCMSIAEELPEILTLIIPSSVKAIPQFLKHLWAFDRFEITDEDMKRTESYKANISRDKEKMKAPTMESFLKNLNLKIVIRQCSDMDIKRIVQMNNRINQFRLSNTNYNEDKIKSLIDEKEKNCYIIEASDKFNHEGIVGFIIISHNKNDLVIEEFMLSCRVLGKGIEKKVIEWLRKYCESSICQNLRINYKFTGKNSLVNKTFAEYPFKSIEGGFETPVNKIKYDTNYIEIVSDLPSPDYSPSRFKKQNLETEYSSKQYDWDIIDTDDKENEIFVKALLNHNSIYLDKMLYNDTDDTDYKNNKLEGNDERTIVLVEVWEKVLRTNNINLDSNFFDIGGNSLLSVKMEVELEKKGWYIEDLNMIENHTISNITHYMKRIEKNG